MADKTEIEWTDATWTPIRARNKATGKVGWHCEHASPGCVNCYAEGFNEKRLGTRLPFKPGHRDDVEHFLDEAMLLQPLRWPRPGMVFVCSMTDLFGEWVPDEMIDRVFAVMALAPQHSFQVLTKRAERMRSYMNRAAGRIADTAIRIRRERGDADMAVVPLPHVTPGRAWWPLPNVWLGISCEDQRRADERIPLLLDTPANIRWVSAEPLLGPIDFRPWLDGVEEHGMVGNRIGFTPPLDWIVAGGESGPGARPMHPAWVRSIRDQCRAAGVAFLFKQWGAWGTTWVNGSTGQPVFRQFDTFERWVNHAQSWINGGVCLDTAGRVMRIGEDFSRARDEGTFPVAILHSVGKKRAGRLLDGVLHDNYPQAEEVLF
jgi:protein gp37